MHHRRGARATPPRAGPPRVPRPRASAQGAQNHNPNAQRPQAPGGGACFSCIKTRSLEHTQDTPVPTPDTHTRSQNTRQSTFLAPSASMEALRFMHGSIRAWSSQAPSPFSPHPSSLQPAPPSHPPRVQSMCRLRATSCAAVPHRSAAPPSPLHGSSQRRSTPSGAARRPPVRRGAWWPRCRPRAWASPPA